MRREIVQGCIAEMMNKGSGVAARRHTLEGLRDNFLGQVNISTQMHTPYILNWLKDPTCWGKRDPKSSTLILEPRTYACSDLNPKP